MDFYELSMVLEPANPHCIIESVSEVYPATEVE